MSVQACISVHCTVLFATVIVSSHRQVIPFGPYLDDDFNYAKLNYVRLFAQARADSVMISLKVGDQTKRMTPKLYIFH